MLQVRIHGRGGQGVVTAAELLSLAAFDEGRYAQAFPSFGSERMGAPVVSFCRIDDREIRLREPVITPDALIVIDPTLLHQVDVFGGLAPAGFVLINTTRSFDELGLGEFVAGFEHERLLTVPASELARKHAGRPVANAALLGGFAALSGSISLDAVVRAIEERFSGSVGEGNVAAAKAAYAWVAAERRELGADAGSSPRDDAPTGRRVTAPPQRRVATLRQIEGSRAVAEAVALCRPEVICAYPISPQTHIVENLSQLVKMGELSPCEFVNVESEFAAMSVAIGASATGARAYTATASQGLLYMAEALYNASGLGLPIVMTVANRAIGAPINIWNDHSDAMSQRDCGWIQLYAKCNQEALDLHIQAFAIAEQLSTPVMVCMDGFVLTHAVERLEMPSQEQADAFLPPFVPRQALDPDEPVTIGAMVGPEAFMEVRYLAHAKQMQALQLIPEIATEFERAFGRDSGGLIHPYRSDDAETIVVALGSVLGTLEETIDELREQGISVGAVGICSFRPFPLDALRAAVCRAKRVVVLEKALAAGIGGIVSANVKMALASVDLDSHTVIAGLGGRPITKASLWRLLEDAAADRLQELTFLDMDWDVVDRELARMNASRASGPHAENILRDLGTVASGPV